MCISKVLSQTLFSLYTADLEKKLRRGRAGGVVIGREKIWSLAYVDDIIRLAKNAQDLKEMLGRMNLYLERKDLVLNGGKLKVVVFKRKKRQKKKEEWRWERRK